MYQVAKKYRVAEVVDIRRYYRDFLLVINKYDLMLAKIHKYILKTATDHEELLFSIMKKFRYSIRLHNSYKSRLLVQHSTFAAKEELTYKGKP